MQCGNNHIGPDEGADEARAMDLLLSKELLQLSVSDRRDMEEEIHGVSCIAPEETPLLIRDSLQKLSMVLDNDAIIPQSEKQAYLRAKYLPMSYVNTEGFRLRFLRMLLFDAVKAAREIVNYLNFTSFAFGEFMLERPLQLSDFNKRELQFMRNGAMQPLPFRDRSGRRVMILTNPTSFSWQENKLFMNQDKSENMKGNIAISAKVATYMIWVLGEDIDVQRKGIVVLSWFDSSFDVIKSNRMNSYANFEYESTILLSVRSAAFHVCLPDTPAFRLMLAVIKLRIGAPLRIRLKAHFGESVECLYDLQSYGIPTEHIPISFSGTIKTGYMKQWMRAREAKESTLYLQMSQKSLRIIECPKLSDVLFRQGRSLSWNPGNARIRSLIEKMQQEREAAESYKLVKFKRREMVVEIIQEIGKTSRFLMWIDGGWWNEILDREQLILKIEYLIKDVRKSKRISRQQKLNSSTSIFRSSSRNNNNDRNNSNGSSDDDGQSTSGCFG